MIKDARMRAAKLQMRLPDRSSSRWWAQGGAKMRRHSSSRMRLKTIACTLLSARRGQFTRPIPTSYQSLLDNDRTENEGKRPSLDLVIATFNILTIRFRLETGSDSDRPLTLVPIIIKSDSENLIQILKALEKSAPEATVSYPGGMA